MIIDYLYPIWTRLCPDKTDTVLVVDPNTMLPLPITDQSLQAIARRDVEFMERSDGIHLIQFPSSDFPDGWRTYLARGGRILAIKNISGAHVSERLDVLNSYSILHTDSHNFCNPTAPLRTAPRFATLMPFNGPDL